MIQRENVAGGYFGHRAVGRKRALNGKANNILYMLWSFSSDHNGRALIYLGLRLF